MNYTKLNSHLQQGATLITSLMLLVVITILGISAIKMSTLNILIASNEQQQMMLFQETESDLINLSRASKLYDPLINDRFNATTGMFNLANNDPFLIEIITDMDKRYSCEGIEGKAVSIGPDVSPCDLYDFQVKKRKQNSGARDTHHRGAGKEVPNPKKNSYL